MEQLELANRFAEQQEIKEAATKAQNKGELVRVVKIMKKSGFEINYQLPEQMDYNTFSKIKGKNEKKIRELVESKTLRYIFIH